MKIYKKTPLVKDVLINLINGGKDGSNDRLTLLIDNAIKIAKFHKEKCVEDCGCSMFLLGQLCVTAGAKLTDEQFRVFM